MNTMIYKAISVIAFTVGFFALAAMVIGFQSGRESYTLPVIEGVLILICLPTAYIANRMGRRKG